MTSEADGACNEHNLLLGRWSLLPVQGSAYRTGNRTRVTHGQRLTLALQVDVANDTPIKDTKTLSKPSK